MATPAANPASNGPGASGNNQIDSQQSSGSLYVGDLHQDVTEALLFEVFSPAGPVSSIRVCRDATSRRSLGYAYVNFHSVQDAERALDAFNFTDIKERPCRIMWSQRDPSVRKNNNSNVFIKNLNKDIDHKQLHDTFSAYGNILSCKVATDSIGKSKGYGFVHYKTEEEAAKAIADVNGKIIMQKKVYVGLFERRTQRAGAGGNSQFTNVYVKNIPDEWDEAKFRSTFESFGKITSLVLQPSEEEGKKHKGFGFVNYEEHENAAKAVEKGCEIAVGDDKKLFVDRFQKKGERSAVLAHKFEEMKREKSEKYKNLNLYVKNLEDTVDEAKLNEMFEPYGEITSCVVMKDDKGASRGFGFVCFANADDASKALAELNGKMIGEKPIYVNKAQRREERRAQLESQFSANLAGQRMQPMAPVYFGPPGTMPGMPQPGMVYQQQMMNRRYPAQAVRGFPLYPPPMKHRGGRNGQGRPAMPNARGKQQFARYNMRNEPHQPPQVPPVSVPVAAPGGMMNHTGELTSSQLTEASPEMQKQILGERLFPLVQKEQPSQAGKITGMLLEMDVVEILALLESPAELQAKLHEAVEVLQNHSGDGTAAEASA